MSRKIIYSQMVTLDGYIEGTNGELEWSIPGDELFGFINKKEENIDAHIYGRKMYENMSIWPSKGQAPDASKEERDWAKHWMKVKKYVISSKLKQEDLQWNTELLNGDMVSSILQLKKIRGGDISLGGASLAEEFFHYDLIDEVWLFIFPILLGDGKRMFPTMQIQRNYHLKEYKRFDDTVFLNYERGNNILKGDL
ncbi:dihydrofolate reductase family protein [Oceanobacillus iheyensis]|uniref:dihydrofolate reductase family protein n=1 Tax=Oceanobacillus iheyensis TaxID=182710 RepID=UPI00363E9FEF